MCPQNATCLEDADERQPQDISAHTEEGASTFTSETVAGRNLQSPWSQVGKHGPQSSGPWKAEAESLKKIKGKFPCQLGGFMPRRLQKGAPGSYPSPGFQVERAFHLPCPSPVLVGGDRHLREPLALPK